jgi:DNA polymerase-3 subunit delta'
VTLDGLRAHRELAERLLDELRARPSHAYLFAGPRGVGKALVAAALAHSMLCARSAGPGFCCTPWRCPVRAAGAETRRPRAGDAPAARCDCCAACVQAAAGVHPDFNYVARPPDRTDVLIEQVRDLIVRLGIRPARAARRVAIIDDAETLNLPAQNALLKTLEEPPGHAIIIVVTASERALLDTVRSRLRPVRFSALGLADLEAILRERGVSDEARAAAIARLARGSAARALALARGDEPPLGRLIEALQGADKLDFVRAQALAQELFSGREQARDNFELIARLAEEMLCSKLLRTDAPRGSAPETAGAIRELADKLPTGAILTFLERALDALEAVDAMANTRLQAEQWWMAAGQAVRGE